MSRAEAATASWILRCVNVGGEGFDIAIAGAEMAHVDTARARGTRSLREGGGAL